MAMTTIGYKLSSEEFGPRELVRFGRLAEDSGFSFALISDHYHPWTDKQGQSPFVWSVLGGLAEATSGLIIGTGVTCPTMRIHPAVIAQAAATAAVMLEGRFFLGVGSGENLNEHVVGARWPAVEVRQAMLEEAVGVIRQLWRGDYQDHHGAFFTVENARIYTRPRTPPPIMVAASGPKAAELAGRIGDGLIATEPEAKLVKRFTASGGKGKPRYAELTVCWGKDEKAARKLAHHQWPNAALNWPLTTELPVPAHFESVVEMVTEDAVAESVVCGPDPDRHVEKIREYVDAGFEHVCVHQVGPDQEGFLRFYAREVLPKLGRRRAPKMSGRRAAA
jgi:coenzyme F420-dependent glucose-6-phosphate dehydrogenase